MNSLRRRALFFRELAVFLDSGTSLREALVTLGESHPVATRALSGIDGGGSLAGILARDVLSAPEGAFLRASERAGTLPDALRRLAQDCEETARTRGRMRTALLYPVMLCLAGAFLVPLGKLLSAGAAAYFRASIGWLLLLGLVAGSVALLARMARGTTGLPDRALLGLPVVGPLLRHAALSRAAHTLSLLNRAGLPLPETLHAAALSSGSATYGAALREIERRVARGASLGAEARRTGAFPFEFTSHLDTGERTGDLASAMERAHRHHREQWDRALAAAARWAQWGAFAVIALAAIREITRGFLAAFPGAGLP